MKDGAQKSEVDVLKGWKGPERRKIQEKLN